MCGIISLISRRPAGFFQEDQKIFNQLLVLDGICRGMDSTGIFQIAKNKTVNIMKNSVDAMMFMKDPEYAQVMSRMISSSRIIVGHNRAATKGKVVPENSHPFHKEDIILVHNGTLYGHKTFADTDVDSEAIAHALSEQHPHEVIPKVDGAFAFVWYNMKTEKLYAVRNSERPLTLTTTANNYILASESEMVDFACKRAKVTIQEQINIEVGKLYEFNLRGEEPVVTDIDVKASSSYYNSGYAWSGIHQHRSQTTRNNTHTVMHNRVITTQEKTEDTEEDGTNVVPIFPDVHKHYSKQDKVLIRVTRIIAGNNGLPDRWVGSIIEPKKPVVDAQGAFKYKLTPQEHSKYYASTTVGEITSILRTNCGWSITVNDVVIDKEYRTYNGKVFSEHEIDHIVNNEVCTHCTSLLDERLVEVMSITRSGIGDTTSYKITCPDCLSERIKDETVKEQFDDLYLALQANIELSETLGRDSTPSTKNILQ